MSARPDTTSLARAFDDSRYGWTRPTRVRRRLVVAEAALLAALMMVTLAASMTDDGWTTGYAVVWSLGLLAFVPLHSLLNLGIRGLFDRSGRSLDEHQRRLRERSFSAMAWPSGGLMLIAWLGAVTLLALTGHTDLALCLGFLAWFTAGLLAYWHLAWTMPDEDEPELGERRSVHPVPATREREGGAPPVSLR